MFCSVPSDDDDDDDDRTTNQHDPPLYRKKRNCRSYRRTLKGIATSQTSIQIATPQKKNYSCGPYNIYRIQEKQNQSINQSNQSTIYILIPYVKKKK